MPALDGTGPAGMGPMTGGGRGWCNPYFVGRRPTMMGSPFIQRFGWGIHQGFGMWSLDPYYAGFRAFPRRFFGFRRGLRVRRRW
jgi:hypothetical protein